MNPSYRKNILRTVKSSLSRFLAIFAIVALGVGFLAGLLAAPGDMRLSADSYYDDTAMYDLRVVSTLGLTEQDLELVRQTEGVESVLPVYDEDLVLLTPDGDSHCLRIPGGRRNIRKAYNRLSDMRQRGHCCQHERNRCYSQLLHKIHLLAFFQKEA